MKRTAKIAAFGLALMLAVLATACNDREAAFFGLTPDVATQLCQQNFGSDGAQGDPCHSSASQLAAKAILARSTSSTSLSDAQLARLAKCESTNNPRAVSRNGKYHGLYQFNQGTWNGVAGRVLPSYVGVSPSTAPSWVQDAFARKLYQERGRSPWPVCGRRI